MIQIHLCTICIILVLFVIIIRGANIKLYVWDGSVHPGHILFALSSCLHYMMKQSYIQH